MSLTLRRAPIPETITEAFDADVRRAWACYLRETRRSGPEDYPAVEERAWRRLAMSLDALGVPLEPPREPDE